MGNPQPLNAEIQATAIGRLWPDENGYKREGTKHD